MKILNTIKSPNDIKELSIEQLEDLAKEIRERIISVVSKTGGHLSSNLGTIELTIALHKVFNSPTDKLIFDVSHQSYTHKILTGRNQLFDSLRQYNGLCGFTSTEESPHDHFNGGHAGVAISLALGLAKNRDLTERNEFILPVIGDGSLTCGTSLEALNNIPKDLKRFIIILNDNEMSISKNVGAISRILNRILNNRTLNKLYNDLEKLIARIPSYGDKLAKQSHKLKASMYHLACPSTFFEHYDLDYFGPIDGHDIKQIIEILEVIKEQEPCKPVIMHFSTKKGNGMEAATKNPSSYHGVRPFDEKTGEFIKPSNNLTFPKIFGRQILKMAENDPSLIAVTPAMPVGSCLTDFIEKFPSRCIDVGIAESHSVTFCGGVAYGKKIKVVASIYSSFLQRAFDNLYHDVCMQQLPILFAIDRAGLAAGDGMSHHGIYDIAFLNAMPNMIIAQPRNGQILKELMESAFLWNKPVAIRYPNQTTTETNEQLQPRTPGKAEILTEGNDLLIIALGTMCDTALETAENLKNYGISTTVLDPIFIKPLDEKLIVELIQNHKYVMTLEEHSLSSGFGSIINNLIIKKELTFVPIWNKGLPDRLIKQGKYDIIMDDLGLSTEKITSFLLEKINQKVLIK